jgi:anti-sigma factor RsiW
MTCDELYRRLTDLDEGVLDGDVCAEVERHLAQCDACRAIRQDLRDLSRLCREQSTARLPDGVRRRIQGLIGATA